MITTVPVHPMTFRILVKENNVLDVHPKDGVLINGDTKSMLNDLIKLGNVDDIDKITNVEDRLSAKISIKHTHNISINNPINIGYYLHKLYMRQALKFIHAQVLAGAPASTSIRNFFKIYEIDEDDMAEETMGRLWRRYYFSINYGKNANKSLSNIPQTVLKNTDVSLLSNKEKINKANSITSYFIRENLSKYFNTKKHFNRSLMHQTLSYTLFIIFEMTQKEIAQLQAVKQQSVCRRIDTFKYFLKSDAILSDSYKNTIRAFL